MSVGVKFSPVDIPHCSRKYLNKTVEGPIYHVDIASSYPFILCAYRFPYGRWGFLGNVLPDQSRFETRAYICKLKLTGVKVKTWNTYISASKCADGRRIISDNGRVLIADELTVWVTEFDYTTIINTYDFDGIESLGCWCCHKQYLPAIYIDFVLQQYEGKCSLKGVDPVKYYLSKTRLNALYGMAVSSIVQSDVIFDPDRGWYVEPLTADKVNYKFDKMRRWFDRSYFLHYAAGCWVTAAARFRLWECIRRIDSDLVYTDTDSLFYLNEHSWDWFNEDATERLKESCAARGIDFERTRPKDLEGIPHPLGVLEPEETADRFRSLGAKKYVEERDGKLFMTVSGVNKAAVSALDTIDDFRDGFVFDKDFEDMHKNEICYLDDMQPITFPDGYYTDIKYGVNMRPTGYELSVPTVYDNVEKTLRALEFPNDEMILRKRGIIVK